MGLRDASEGWDDGVVVMEGLGFRVDAEAIAIKD